MLETIREEVRYSDVEIDGEKLLAKHTITIQNNMSINSSVTLYRKLGGSSGWMSWGTGSLFPVPNNETYKGLVYTIRRQEWFKEEYEKYLLANPIIVKKLMKQIEKAEKEEAEKAEQN